MHWRVFDASGKATQSKLLAEHLKAKLFSFPNYETETGKAILENLKGRWTAAYRTEAPDPPGPPVVNTYGEFKHMNALALQSFMALNRYESAHLIDEALATQHVVLDRYWPSGWVYGTCDGLDGEWLLRIHERLPQPDALVLIDVPPTESVARRPERRDRYEKDPHMGRRRELYLKLWEAMEDRRHWMIVDGVGTPREVQLRIATELRGFFGRDFIDDKEI